MEHTSPNGVSSKGVPTTRSRTLSIREPSIDDFMLEGNSSNHAHHHHVNKNKSKKSTEDLKPECSPDGITYFCSLPHFLTPRTDVRCWMNKQGIGAHTDAFLKHNMGHRSLMELQVLLESKPKIALELIREVLGTKNVGDILAVSAAVRDLNCNEEQK